MTNKRQGRRKVSETHDWFLTFERPHMIPMVRLPLLSTTKFKEFDRVRVTVELVERKKVKG